MVKTKTVVPLEQREGSQLKWDVAPMKTQWGAGMMEALVELNKDETANIYAHEDALHLVDGALRSMFGYPKVVGYMVHSSDVAHAALYPLSQHSEALDAAHRWNACITALVCAPGGPEA